MSVILLFPAGPGPIASGMNYTVVVVGGIILFCMAYYFLPKKGGRFWFNGPIQTVGLDREYSGVRSMRKEEL